MIHTIFFLIFALVIVAMVGAAYWQMEKMEREIGAKLNPTKPVL